MAAAGCTGLHCVALDGTWIWHRFGTGFGTGLVSSFGDFSLGHRDHESRKDPDGCNLTGFRKQQRRSGLETYTLQGCGPFTSHGRRERAGRRLSRNRRVCPDRN